MPMKRLAPLILFLVLVMGGGVAIGFLTAPGEWYAGLAKPSFNPPNWLFGPVWTLLYLLIAVAGWRVFESDRGGWPMKLWWAQLALNFLWSPVFFAAHQISFCCCSARSLLSSSLPGGRIAWRHGYSRPMRLGSASLRR
jgi:tryptophan-rich sensory protein